MSDSDVVIRVEGLGKKYALHHEQPERYRALRDSIAHRARAAGKLLNPFTLAGQLRRAQRHAAHEQRGAEEEFWALKDVSFEIRRGERVGIIGRNGAGKSTLLKILSRITEPTTGRVEIRGRVASLLEVGTGFHPELTGRENIYLNGAILGMTRREIRSKFDAIVDFAEVEKFLDTPVKRYSSGMYVRLAFAVAAHLEPEILVVDEVLAVGDASFQKKCLGKMEGFTEGQGRALIFVSHQMGALASICESGLLLDSGLLTYHGAVSETIDRYLAKGRITSKTPLSDRKDREGSGELKFIEIQVLDKFGNDYSQIISGSALEIRAACKASACIQDLHRVVFAIDLLDRDSRFAAIFSSNEMGITINKNKSCKEGDILGLRLWIPELTLREAVYSVRLSVSLLGTDSTSRLDGINEATWLNVIRGDYWQTGNLNMPGSFGIVQGSLRLETINIMHQENHLRCDLNQSQ
ncbi:ABC transporter ATP-binding protein [Synechococcus sp. GFB01]|uniref:ABC transporter ATP-binding protein n=1 Tax=Synechococcus sp. GFB01 TaxID=1662190 RepID=UPI00064E9793|nr:ABC transporter ATP-binding protein [Synechococcus sp. GFB01]KMM17575.1 hypothetical protein SYNGFB01_03070 [Synechococcus sp. GFB01]